MRLLLIVNASASAVTARSRVVIHKALAADHEVEVVETGQPGHATALARRAAAAGTGAVVVLGGDGTLNEAANGLAGTDTALGALPGGSTNVFARTIGMTNDPIEATGQLLAALDDHLVVPVGLGRAGGRYFLFHVGLGFDAAVVARAERHSPLKRHIGPALFAAAAAWEWLGAYDRRRPHFSASAAPRPGAFSGALAVHDGYFGICLNTSPYTYIGERPIDLAPGTGLHTALTMVTFRGMSLAVILPALVSALRGRGSGQPARRVEVWRDVVAVDVEAPGGIPHQVDGEYLGEATSLQLSYEPDALRLVLPPGASP